MLHAIFPNYPDMLGNAAAPDVRAFLRTLLFVRKIRLRRSKSTEKCALLNRQNHLHGRILRRIRYFFINCIRVAR